MSMNEHLQDAAQAMIAAAEAGGSVVPVLRQRCPHIYRQIIRDGMERDLLTLWGKSCNIDENVSAAVIVAPAILQAIGSLAGVPMRGRFVHAGLAHTYGYLFSLIETPFGPKRDRWVTTDLENGFGLDPTLLGDCPREGTLLANVTGFLGRIVFRGQPALKRIEVGTQAAALEVRNYDYTKLAVHRIVERVRIADGSTPEVLLLTDLVPYRNPPADSGKEGALLIYSVQRGARAMAKLITAFPIMRQSADDLAAAAQSPRRKRVRLRYNAYVRGLFGRSVWGSSKLAKATTQN